MLYTFTCKYKTSRSTVERTSRAVSNGWDVGIGSLLGLEYSTVFYLTHMQVKQ